MTRLTTLELSRESMSFSSGHFMIFSEHEREHFHGHNYQIHAAFTFAVGRDGINFNCQDYIDILSSMCTRLNRFFLLPTESRYLQIEETETHYQVHFGKELFTFLRTEVILLPITNISMEELSRWFLEEFCAEHQRMLVEHAIDNITMKVYSAPGISASSSWQAA